MPPGERITVGLVHGIHGLRGAVRIEVLSDHPERFAAGSRLYAQDEERPLTVAWVRDSKPGLLVRFEELTSREAVEPLRGRYLEAVSEESLPEGSHYWHELVGMEVRTTDGAVLGTVGEVFRAGAGEVYVVRGGPLGEIMVPGVRSVVQQLDPAGGLMTVDAVALALPDKPPRRRRRQEVARRMRKTAS